MQVHGGFMATHFQAETDKKLEPEKPLIPEPAGDGFPQEKDVSTPPPGTDQDSERDEDGTYDETAD